MQHQIGQSNRLGAEYQIAQPRPAARSDLPLLLKVLVRNTGAIGWPDDQRRPINLSYHWLDRRGRIVDYEGVRAALPEPLPPGASIELELSVDADGAFRLRTGVQRLYEWPIPIRIPNLVSGRADVRESYNDKEERYEVDVTIGNRFLGRIFGYRGWFRLDFRPCTPEEIPRDARPQREERRE